MVFSNTKSKDYERLFNALDACASDEVAYTALTTIYELKRFENLAGDEVVRLVATDSYVAAMVDVSPTVIDLACQFGTLSRFTSGDGDQVEYITSKKRKSGFKPSFPYPDLMKLMEGYTIVKATETRFKLHAIRNVTRYAELRDAFNGDRRGKTWTFTPTHVATAEKGPDFRMDFGFIFLSMPIRVDYTEMKILEADCYLACD